MSGPRAGAVQVAAVVGHRGAVAVLHLGLREGGLPHREATRRRRSGRPRRARRARGAALEASEYTTLAHWPIVRRAAVRRDGPRRRRTAVVAGGILFTFREKTFEELRETWESEVR